MRKLLLFLAFCAAAQAATIIFTTLPGNAQYGTDNGFAGATIDGVAGQLLICDDYQHTTYMPSGPLSYLESSLGGSNPLQYARFVDPNDWERSVERYEQAALLLDGLQHGAAGIPDLTAEYQYALWHLFTPSVQVETETARMLLEEAGQRLQQALPPDIEIVSRLRIYTPTREYASNQEFLQLVDGLPPSAGAGLSTPEPGPAALAGIGLLMIALPSAVRLACRRVAARRTSMPDSNPPEPAPSGPSAS